VSGKKFFSRKSWFGILFFFVAVLLLTRLDYLINNTFYSYGLVFSYGWYREYTLLYSLSYQLVIFLLLLWTRNKYLLLATEAFVFSATQDLIFFGLWCGRFPPADWTWMLSYEMLGFWTTSTQLFASILVNGLVFGFCAWRYKASIITH